MPVLVATFRSLLNEAEPGLEAHLHSVGFSPSECALKWMVSGFVSVLDVEEVRTGTQHLLFSDVKALVNYSMPALEFCSIRQPLTTEKMLKGGNPKRTSSSRHSVAHAQFS